MFIDDTKFLVTEHASAVVGDATIFLGARGERWDDETKDAESTTSCALR